MQQVIINLAVNARDAMPDGGVLTIETGTLVFDDEDMWARRGLPGARYVTVTVSDTGVGMSSEVLERAFEPSFTTKPSGEGIRLGTTVHVYLPAMDEPARMATPSAAPTVRPGAGETILVVEDEHAMREVAVRILRRNGYRVLDAADADEALAMLDDHACDLLLTDVIMPQMSGHELVERARARHPDLMVLYMSGYSVFVRGPQRALDGSVALIQKPFSEQALLEKVRAVFIADGPDAG
jgi:CheY-like chemotaxis protein